jgi:glucose-6-phosphate isomerase
MESLGKADDLKGKRVEQGIAVYGNKGSTDQHAYVQQLREGVNNFFAVFVRVLTDGGGASGAMEVEPSVTAGDYLDGLWQGTRRALYENGRQSMTITIPQVDAFRVGALIALFERAVGLYATLVGINAYHQPGVEAGKKAAASVLGVQQGVLDHLSEAKDGLDAAGLAAAMGKGEEVETVHHVLSHLEANGRVKRVGGDGADAKYKPR